MPPQYRSISQQSPPKTIIESAQMNAHTLWRHAQQNHGVLWRGDFYQAKQLLSALKKRVRQPAKTGNTPAETFHKHRLAQSQQSRLINQLLVEIHPDFQLRLPRAPDLQAALNDVYDTPNTESFLLPLNQLLGFIGAHEWHKKGIFINALNDKIHVPFGVFSPLRGEYLDLVMRATLPENTRIAFDIGTGSGVLAALLAKRKIPRIIATDTNPRAIHAANTNAQRLGYATQIQVLPQSLFPAQCADLIVCNPPWLPAKPSSVLETAIYDPEHAMLHALLRDGHKHLNPNGQLWIIMSDFAEHLGLRAPDDLPTWFAQYGWQIVQRHNTKAQHPKAQYANDTLAFARRAETTSLYILKAAP